MSVNASTGLSGPFTPNGATVAFPFTFPCLSVADVAVLANNARVTSGFVVSLNADQLNNPGGTVTYATAPATGSGLIIIYSDPVLDQETNFQAGVPWNAAATVAQNSANDRAVIIAQALQRDIARALLFPIGASPEIISALPGEYLVLDANGNPIGASGTGADAGLRTDLASSASGKGTALIAFLASGAGATATTVQGKLWTICSVYDYGAAGDGTTNDFAALNEWLQVQKTAFVGAYVDAGNFVTTYNQAFQYSGRWHPASQGYAVIGARKYPFGDITQNLTVYVGAAEPFTSIASAYAYLMGRRIIGDITVIVSVADGTYAITQLYMAHGDGAKIQIIGNSEAPANVILNADMTNNLSCFFVAAGCALGFVNGFTINGVGARTGYGAWAGNCYGGGIVAQSGCAHVGPNMVINNCYYGVLAESGASIICEPGVIVTGAGDVGFHARWGSYMQASQCSASNCADNSVSLGCGFNAEGGSFLECRGSTGSGNAIALVGVSGNSTIWAMGCMPQANGLYGAVVFSGFLDIGYDPILAQAPIISGNNQGIAVFGGFASIAGISGNPVKVYGNVYDAIHLENDGSTARGAYIEIGVTSANGGLGVKAITGARAAFSNVTFGTNSGGNTLTDTGNNSNIRTM